MNIEAEEDLPATKMVEHFMLMYMLNAETLFAYNKQTILRSHKKTPQSLIDKSTPELNEFINRLKQNGAKYVIDHDGGSDSIIHESLGFAYYTHATSPIRRYVDIINQINLLRYISCQPAFIISQEQADY